MNYLAGQIYARPYAEAAYRFAEERKDISAWKAFLEEWVALLADKNFATILDNPFFNQEQFIHIITQELKKNIAFEQESFLLQLAENKRLKYLPEILNYFCFLYDQKENLLRVKVISAFPLDEKNQKILLEKLTQKFDKKIILEIELDPTLIGGLQIKVGDKLLDASVKHRLQELTQLLKKSTPQA